MKYALIIDDVVDTISFEPQDGEGWEVVGEDVFAGFVRDDGGWRAPAAEPPLAASTSLTLAQWQYFLDLASFREPLDAALAAMPKATLAERKEWAGMRSVAYASESYGLDATLQLVALVRLRGLPIDIPSDKDIQEAFADAAAFKGAETLLEGAE